MNVDHWIVWNFSYIVVAIYTVMLTSFVSDIIYIIIKKIKYVAFNKKTILKAYIITSALFTIIFASYGILNSQIVTKCDKTFVSDKLDNNYTLAVISDLHAGTAQSLETIKETLDNIKYENPDFLILNGDITDEYTTKEYMEELYSVIGNLNITTYFIYGNHDLQKNCSLANGKKYTKNDLLKTLSKNNIKILQDEITQINNSIDILGRNDITNNDRKNLNNIPGFTDEKFKIIFEHNPNNILENTSLDADLQISGHTHAGQYFPINYIANLFNIDCYGEFKHENTTLLVSSGVGVWKIPFRTSEHCEYNIIHLTNNND